MNRSRKARTVRKPQLRHKLHIIKRVVTTGVPLVALAWIGGFLCRDVMRYLNRSERYRVKEIEVIGIDRLAKETVIACSGIHVGAPVFSINRDEAASGVMAQPRVKSATVVAIVPDRVSITVVERVAVALVVFDKPYELDGEGVMLGAYEKNRSPQGPIISGVKEPQSVLPGIPLTDDGLKEALELWRLFSAAPISAELSVSEIDISDAQSLIMILENRKYEIRWPRKDLADALSRLDYLWQGTSGFPKTRQYIDLRFGDIEQVPTR